MSRLRSAGAESLRLMASCVRLKTISNAACTSMYDSGYRRTKSTCLGPFG